MKSSTAHLAVILALLGPWVISFAFAESKVAGVKVMCSVERRLISEHVKELLDSGEFEKLTKLAQEYRASKAALSDGSSKLNQFYESFSGSTAEDYDELLKQLENWGTKELKDPAPIIALGNAYWSFGKHARGNNFVNTVTEEGWKLLKERLEKGHSKLSAQFDRCKVCPGYFVVMMKLGIDGGIERKPFMKLFEQGTALSPEYANLYEMKSYYILPRWYGEPGELKKFIQSTAEFYPQIAMWVMWRLQIQGVYENVIKEESLDFDKLKVAVEKYAKAARLTAAQENMLAYLADLAGDEETVNSALKSADYKIDASIWRSKERMHEIGKKLARELADKNGN